MAGFRHVLIAVAFVCVFFEQTSLNARQPFGLLASETTTTTTQSTTTTRVGIAAISDKGFQKKQKELFANHRAYAELHDYDYWVLDPEDYPVCNYNHFFFNKHCVVRQFLDTVPLGYSLFVIDGDNLVVSPQASLDRWIQQDTDIFLFERDWNFEITAGNYMVRNSPLAHRFLELWAGFDQRSQLIQGFHSADNGAIHLVVLELIDSFYATDYGMCEKLYQNLRMDVTDLTEYYQFVGCTRTVLGPNRKWRVSRYAKGTLTIHHRFHGFAADATYVELRSGGAIPFAHGVKDVPKGLKTFQESKPWGSPLEQGEHLADIDQDTTCTRRCTMPWKVVPRIQLKSCLPTFSCDVAVDNNALPLIDTYRASNSFVFEHGKLYHNATESIFNNATKSRFSCGGHLAKTCALCIPSDVTGNGRAGWCNGECFWSQKSDQCMEKGHAEVK